MNTPRFSRILHDPATGREVEIIYSGVLQSQSFDPGGESPMRDGLLDQALGAWRLILSFAAAGLIAGLITVTLMPNRYTAIATALPPMDNGGMPGGLSQYAGLAAVAGIQLPGSPGSSIDSIMAILGSRRLRAAISEKFNLREYYGVELQDDALSRFAQDFSARDDKKTGIITISVTLKSPGQAQKITNEAADLLKTIYNELNQSKATLERQFLEGRLKQTSADLEAAAKELALFQVQRGTIEIEGQTKATIEVVARFQEQLIAYQIELSALSASAIAPDNPNVRLLQQRINAMTVELHRLMGKGGEPSGALLGLATLPQIGVEYLEKYRAVKKHEAILTALTSQLEAARISEIRTSEVITIVDRANLPERKSGPPKIQICILATVLGALSGCISAFYFTQGLKRKGRRLGEAKPA